MSRRSTLHRFTALLLAAGGVLLSAQAPQLPSAPLKQFGAGITASFDGWYDNPDGSHNLLIGYLNRNTESELDIPIGANNRFEPGAADRGQPTHFLTRRRFGMFVVTVPRETPKTEKIAWTLTVNGVTTSVPMYQHVDYGLAPLKSSEESPDRSFNVPPTLRFAANGPSFFGPGVTPAAALERIAKIGVPMALDVLVDDDGRYSTGTNGPMNNPQAPVSVTISPASASVRVNRTHQFTATVQNATNNSVVWKVNGMTGGNATVGTISTSGLYRAPSSVPSPAVVTVSATSAADPSKSAAASVTVTRR